MTAPEKLLNRLRGLSTKELVSVAARFRLGDGPSDVPTATRFALRSVARRYARPSGRRSSSWTRTPRSAGGAGRSGALVSLPGIGTDNAATLLIVALKTTPRGSEERGLLRQSSVRGSSHRGFLRQGGEASSQPRVGNRDANRALYMICLAWMRRDRRTQEYVALVHDQATFSVMDRCS